MMAEAIPISITPPSAIAPATPQPRPTNPRYPLKVVGEAEGCRLRSNYLFRKYDSSDGLW